MALEKKPVAHSRFCTRLQFEREDVGRRYEGQQKVQVARNFSPVCFSSFFLPCNAPMHGKIKREIRLSQDCLESLEREAGVGSLSIEYWINAGD